MSARRIEKMVLLSLVFNKGAFGIIDGKTNAPGGRGFIPRNRLKFCMAARIMCNLPLTLLMPPKNILNHD